MRPVSSLVRALLAAALVLAALPCAVRALRTDGNFKRDLRASGDYEKYVVETRFLDYYKSKFAFTAAGIFNASISLKVTAFNGKNKTLSLNQAAAASCLKVAFCDVTNFVVRDSSYQMKRVFLLESPDWKKDMASDACTNRKAERQLKCTSQNLNPSSVITYEPGKAIPPAKNRIILINLINCVDCIVDVNNQTTKIATDVTYDVSMLNRDSRFQELGWEEEAYPYAASVITALAIAVFFIVSVATAISYYRGHGMHFVLKVLLCTSTVKILSSSLTAAAFWRASFTGKLMVWFFVLRVPLIIVDEILIGLLMLVMSTGIGMMPASWSFDRRSSTFAVFLGLALELFTVVTSEVVFAYRYLGLIVFLFSGGTVAFIGILFSWKNIRFLAKYAKLVRMANIYVHTTPLLRMGLFFNVNAALVLLLWLFKIVTFGVMDHVLFRPDLLWTCFEASDVTLLVWYAFAVFPRRKSAFYVDMSHVDNVRLREVNAWLVRQAQREAQAASANGDEANIVSASLRANGGAVSLAMADSRDARQSTSMDSGQQTPSWYVDSLGDDPEPEWISWESGMTLPVPTTGMWNVNEDVRRVLKRQRAIPSAESQVRVLGSPMESPESLSLTIAKPIIGPDAPKRPGARLSPSSGARTTGPSQEGGMGDRNDPIGAEDGNSGVGLRLRQSVPRGRIIGDEEAGMEIMPMEVDGDRGIALPSRRRVPSFVEYADSEMFSVPSSNASADGEVFSEHSGRGRRR